MRETASAAATPSAIPTAARPAACPTLRGTEESAGASPKRIPVAREIAAVNARTAPSIRGIEQQVRQPGILQPGDQLHGPSGEQESGRAARMSTSRQARAAPHRVRGGEPRGGAARRPGHGMLRSEARQRGSAGTDRDGAPGRGEEVHEALSRATLTYTLVTVGVEGRTDREEFSIRVR